MYKKPGIFFTFSIININKYIYLKKMHNQNGLAPYHEIMDPTNARRFHRERRKTKKEKKLARLISPLLF